MYDLDWKNTILEENGTIKDAIKVLNNSGKRIVLICTDKKRLVGTVSDGDIRRGLVKGLDIDSPITGIIKRDAITASIKSGENSLISLMDSKEILQLPLVEDSFIVAGLYLRSFSSSPNPIENPIVIMAGGLGKRLMPRTENCPKPLLEVRGKPILQHIIESAKKSGFKNFIISLNYLGYMIEDFFGDGQSFDVKITYIKEEEPLGTAGALSLINPVPSIPIIVANGDLISDIDFGDLLNFHLQNNAVASMAVRVFENRQNFGVVEIEGIDIVGFEEKPIIKTKLNAGVYALNPEALIAMEYDTKCDMPSLFTKLQKRNNKILAYLMYESWTDVGREDDYLKVNKIKK